MKELAYRIYITDSLYYQADNKRLTTRYAEIIAKPKPADKRSADKIAEDTIKKLGLKVL